MAGVPTNPVKCVMGFGLQRQTWTEAHYSALYTDPTNTTAQAAAQELAAARVKMLGFGANLISLKLYSTSIRKLVQNVILTGVPTSPGELVLNGISNDAMIPNVSAIVRANDAAGHAKNLYLACIPNNCIEQSDTDPPYFNFTGPLASAWTAYIKVLQSAWLFRVSAPGVAAAVQGPLELVTSPATAIGCNVPTGIPGAPVAAPFYVTAAGFRRESTRAPNLSGRYRVIAIQGAGGSPGTGWYVLGNTAAVPPTNFSQLGTLALAGFTYAPYVNLSISKVGTRERGGSLGGYRGKSRTRA
jgi:hypothetical protein